MKRIISLLLVAAMALCVQAPFVFAAEPMDPPQVNAAIYTSNEAEQYATREEAVFQFISALGKDRLSEAAADLHRFADYDDINPQYEQALSCAVGNGLVSGYEDGTIRPKSYILRVEALVLLSRALGGTELVPLYERSFSDTPQWANFDVQRLASAGILLGYGDGTFGAEDYITAEQIQVLIARITAQPTAQNDFFDYVNSEWDAYTQIPDGYPEWSDTYQLSQDIAYRIQDILSNLINQKLYLGVEYPQGSNEQKLVDVFLTAADTKYRDDVGLNPIRPYLNMIDQAHSVTDLVNVMAQLEQSGFHSLIPLKMETDFKNSSKYCLAFEGSYTGVDTAIIQSGEHDDLLDEYETYIKRLYVISGMNESDAGPAAAKVRAFCSELAMASLSSTDWDNMEQLYNKQSLRNFNKIFSSMDTYDYLRDMGYEHAKYIVVMDEGLARFINKFLTKDNIPLLKNYLKASLLDQCAFYLNTDMYNARQDYTNKLNGTNSRIDASAYAISITQSLLGLELGELYIENFFADETKEYVEELAKEIVTTYEHRINSLTWMKEKTKRTAIEKLRAINIQVGYPEYLIGYQNEDFKVRSGGSGGNLMENMIHYNQLTNHRNAYVLTYDIPVDRDEWVMLPQTVNAYYNLTTNSIVLPAGILQAPYYNPQASYEANLGGIGRIIAHEVTHAFDNVGSQFDKNGNLSDWWTAEDFAAFDSLCQEFIAAYDQIEYLPGYYVDGRLTLSENIADVGSMACVLDLAGTDNPNLKELFESYAISWRSKSTDDYKRLSLTTDVHAPDKVRTNMVLSNFETFLDFYGIKEGDGMYISAEDRISIW